jgi:hypothetical protein
VEARKKEEAPCASDPLPDFHFCKLGELVAEPIGESRRKKARNLIELKVAYVYMHMPRLETFDFLSHALAKWAFFLSRFTFRSILPFWCRVGTCLWQFHI